MSADPQTRPGNTLLARGITLARLGIVSGPNDEVSQWEDVHFNPASLQVQITNELKDTKNNERKQYIAKSTTKLTMDLQFDTTDKGTDVVEVVRKIRLFVHPENLDADKSPKEPPPPLVKFQWGTFVFKGIVENYKETLDYFAPEGVPLRAMVNLTLSAQKKAFNKSANDPQTIPGKVDGDFVDASASSASDAAHRGQSPEAARAIGEANGADSLRFSAGASVGVSASVVLKPPVAFASAGAGLSLGAGVGAGAGAGLGIGAGLGAGASLSAGASVGASASFGAGASIGVSASASAGAGISGLAGLSASEGAFAGLRVTAGSGPSMATVNTSRLMPSARSSAVATDSGAAFLVGGRASFEGAAGLRADVGAQGSVGGKLTFDAS